MKSAERKSLALRPQHIQHSEMNYSADSDLNEYQPYVFEHGINDFTLYHAKAALDIQRDVKALWLPLQRTLIDPARTGRNLLATDSTLFDADNLNPDQWVKASVFRVLSAYVLPRLGASVGGQGFLAMLVFYEKAYGKELQSVFDEGVEYKISGVFQKIFVMPLAARLRQIR